MESVDGVSSAVVPAHMDGDSLWHGDSMLGWGGVSCQDAQASRSGRVLLLSASPPWTTICCRHRVVCGALAPRSVSVKLSFCLVHAPALPIPLTGAEGIKLRLRGTEESCPALFFLFCPLYILLWKSRQKTGGKLCGWAVWSPGTNWEASHAGVPRAITTGLLHCVDPYTACGAGSLGGPETTSSPEAPSFLEGGENRCWQRLCFAGAMERLWGKASH